MPMAVQIKSGDLLRQDADAIVNTVNCVGVMGKGIALQFKQKWPENFRAYERACRLGQVKIGRMFLFDSGGLVRPHFIINFPTKTHWREKSRIEYIEAGLKDLVAQVKRLGIKSIALPPLGCGNGGLSWERVRNLISEAFSSLPDVDVLLFEPKGAPSPQEMVNRTDRPRMTPGRAAIIKILSVYREMQYALSHLEVQKLVYFLEAAGQPLDLSFGKSKYGPYSERLWHALKRMDGHYINGVGDRTGEAEIVVVPEALSSAETFLSAADDISGLREKVERVSDLIEGFETPYGMELLATVHWVVHHEPFAKSPSEALSAVHAWSSRKRQILKPQHIRIAWNRLAKGGWLPDSVVQS
jgi:O-acetyl-ADP-ribose deacetylase (regulator of RNase III)